MEGKHLMALVCLALRALGSLIGGRVKHRNALAAARHRQLEAWSAVRGAAAREEGDRSKAAARGEPQP